MGIHFTQPEENINSLIPHKKDDQKITSNRTILSIIKHNDSSMK